MTDCLGHLIGLKTRYVDLIAPQKQPTQTADEIISDMKEKLARIGGE